MSDNDFPAIPDGLDFSFDGMQDAAAAGSPLFDDVIVVHLPHLAIVSEADFAKVLAMRSPGREDAGQPRPRHPLTGKWKCCHCGGTMLMDSRNKWMRCEKATSAWRTTEEHSCVGAPIDLAVAERLMFEALDTFAVGRGGEFAKVARRRYDEVIRAAFVEREQLKKDADHHRTQIRKLARELIDGQGNQALRASIQEMADEHERLLTAIEAKIQNMPAEVEEPDPTKSLLELQNMIDAIKMQTPFGFGVNKEALSLQGHLNKVIRSVSMKPRGDDFYDVEFVLDAAAAMKVEGKDTEIVRFTENLKAGKFKVRNKRAGYEAKWLAGKMSISDRAWKKRPPLPLAEKLFGEHVRWMVDTMIVTAETGMGTRAVVTMCGSRVVNHRIQSYRASEECTKIRDWLNEVRPRKHGYDAMLPTGKAPTLRTRLESVGHPLLDLKRLERSDIPAPLSDQEWEELLPLLDEVQPQWVASMRMRIDQTLEMIRCDQYATWAGPQSYRIWLNTQIRRGTLLKVMNFFRRREGMVEFDILPEIPGSRSLKAEGL